VSRLHHFNGQCAALMRLRLPLAMAKYGAGAATGALADTLDDVAANYVDVTGKPLDPAKIVLFRLGLADYPNLVRRDQLPADFGAAQGNPPVAPATPVLSKESAISGPTQDIFREAPEWRPPPPSHSSQPASGSGEVLRHEDVPADNEPQVGSGSGGGGALSHAGAEVSVPDQTPQRQAMTLYDVPSSDVGNIWENYDRRLQNPATNSIIRFVSE
jgi:hypothetical protein